MREGRLPIRSGWARTAAKSLAAGRKASRPDTANRRTRMLRGQRSRRRQPLGRRRLIRAAALTAMVTAALCGSLVPTAATLPQDRAFQFDFRGDLYAAGRAIVDGRTPYDQSLLEREAAIMRAGGTAPTVASPRWPPPILIAMLPLSLLPFGLAAGAFMALSLAALILALRLFGVRDWRCVAIACVSWPSLQNLWLGNISSLVFLGTALAWRCRARTPALAGAVAGVIALKLFVWPLAIWLLVTRRLRALALASASGLVLVLAAWALIGFAGLSGYPRMLANVAYIGERKGPSLVGTLLAAGLPVWSARMIAVGLAGAMLALAWRLRRAPDGDRRAFALAVMASLTATPVLWYHYLLLLFVPIALLSPAISPMWFLPLLVPVFPALVTVSATDAPAWANLPDLAIQLTLIGWLALPILPRLRRPAPWSQTERWRGVRRAAALKA
jgi:hypothetical protein